MIFVGESHLKSFSAHLANELPVDAERGEPLERHVQARLSRLAELSQPDVCEKRRAAFGFDIPAKAFAERLLIERDGATVIAGIRFRNLDPEWPFVEVNADFDLLRSDTLPEISELARHAFHPFSPKGVQFSGQPEDPTDNGAAVWTHAVLGRTDAAAPVGQHDVEITFPRNVTFYEEYLDAYATWAHANSGLKAFVKPESKEDLEEAAQAGLLAVARDSAGWCGVVAASMAPFFGTTAGYIFEVLVTERRRGQGLGRSIDSALMRRLSKCCIYVWEDIHDRNVASFRTAARQGRRAVRTDYFVPFENLPRN
jgi:hypothetical protein